jgi:hypothetical protein
MAVASRERGTGSGLQVDSSAALFGRSALVDQIAVACQRQTRLIDDAVDSAIKGVPLPVRGIVKKALVG